LSEWVNRKMRLNIGAGMSSKSSGSINADLYLGPNIDVVFDATKGWPFKDNSIEAIVGVHVLEHLSNPWTFFKEAWRVLRPSKKCNLQLRLPYGPSSDGLGDLTHLRQWVPGSFCCFQPGYNEAVFNPQHNGWKQPFSVMSIYLRINPALRWLVKPIIRRWGLRIIEFLWGGYVEMIVGMRAIKDYKDELRWRMENKANIVPVAYCMYEHDYKGKSLNPGESPRYLFFGEGARQLQRSWDAHFA